MEEDTLRSASKLDRAVVARELECRRCHYDLRALRIGGRCPECGCAVWESVLHAVDPKARELPLIRDPHRVGDGLVMLISLLGLASVMLLARPVAVQVDALRPVGAIGVASWTPAALSLLAGLSLWCGLWPLWKLTPPRGKEPRGAVWRDVWLVALGLALGGALAIASWTLVAGPARGVAGAGLGAALISRGLHLGMAAAALVIAIGLRGVFRVIGERSRQYRTARGGRQRIQDLMAAALGIAAGHVLGFVAAAFRLEGLVIVGTVIVWTSALMLVVGLLYLQVNAWWIRRSLRRVAPTLRDLLASPGEVVPGEESDAWLPPESAE